MATADPRYNPADGALLDNGERLEARDCPRCGRPVLVGRYYGVHRDFGDSGPVVLDALPLRAFRVVSPFFDYVCEEVGPLYSEHVCEKEAREPIAEIARCPEHGLHGDRHDCYVCGGPVERVRMRPVEGVNVPLAAC